MDDAKSCQNYDSRGGTRSSLKETAKLLQSQVEKFDKMFIVIDTPDEYAEVDQTQKIFFAKVLGLRPKVKLVITSRNTPSIQSIFKHVTYLKIRAQD